MLESKLLFHGRAGNKKSLQVPRLLICQRSPVPVIYRTDSTCVTEGQITSPPSCAAAPSSANWELGVQRWRCPCQNLKQMCDVFISVTQCSLQEHHSSPLMEAKLLLCSSFLSAVVNKCKQRKCFIHSRIFTSEQNEANKFSAFFIWPLKSGQREGQVSDFHSLHEGCMRQFF